MMFQISTPCTKAAMKNIINISTSDDKARFIDALSVTGIHVYPDKDEMTIFNANGRVQYVNTKSVEVDTGALLQKLAAAGNPLVSLPLRHEDKEYPHFVSPAAVTFATVTEVGKDGKQGVIVGVRGVGWEESYGTKPEELAALLDAVRGTGKTLLEFNPEQAHARWYNAAALYIDPAAVREIRDDGMQVNVLFEGSGSLDVQTDDHTYSGNRENELLNKLWKDGGQKPDADLNALAREARRLIKEEEETKRADFALVIAAANGTLTQLTGTNRAIYIHPEEFTAITFHTQDRENPVRYGMSLERQKTDNNPYPESVRAYFNSAAEREASFKALVSSAAPRAKNPPAPKNGGSFGL